MPTTINSIGTRYSGKHNVQQRVGVCRSCGRSATLTSYDTRLFFVVFFIPIIPLGRKHIIDECSACRRHFVVEMDKWEMARQLETSGALEKFRSEPTVENAIHAHQQLVTFHQIAEAAELQRTMEEKFSDNARVLVYLAGSQQHLGRQQEAAALFKRALDLRPDLPEARIGVAEAQIRAGQLDEARKWLDFLENPGAAQLYNLAPLENLARAYQNVSRHVEAVDLFGKLLLAFPAIGQNPQFRKWVKTSEKALAVQTSILPKAKFNFRNFFSLSVRTSGAGRPAATRKMALVAIVVAAVVLPVIMQISNVMISHGRSLCVVNGTGNIIQGEITGLGRIKVYPGETTFHVKEGHYVAKFDPPLQEPIEFDIRSKYFDRWTYHPVWVLNPDNSAILVKHRVLYSRGGQPGSYSYEFGKKLSVFMDVEYPFTTPPATMQVSSTEQQRVLGALEVFRGTAVEAFNSLVADKKFPDAYRLAEWRLAQAPDDRKMLNAYMSAASTHGDLQRYAGFLHDGLNARPIRVEWHRTYQNLLLTGNRQRLIREYDAMLATNSGDAILLYLRGRVCESDAEGMEYFIRSLQADPENPYAAYALAFHAQSQADWATAKRLMDKPVKQQPENLEFAASWSLACLGLNDLDELEKEWRKRAAGDTVDLTGALNLCQTLVVAGKTNEAREAIGAYCRATNARYGAGGKQLEQAANYSFSYFVGDFEGLEKTAKGDSSVLGRGQMYVALIGQNRAEEAAKLIPLTDPAMQQWTEVLPMALALYVAGNSAEAAKWQNHAVELVRKSGDKKQIVDWLSKQVEPTAESVKALEMTAPTKALLLADLIYVFPEHRAELAELARKLNIERIFPYYLIERALENPR